MDNFKKYSASLFVFFAIAMFFPLSVKAVIGQKKPLRTERIGILQKHKSKVHKRKRKRAKLWNRIKNRVQQKWFSKWRAAKGKANKKIRFGLLLLGIGVASLVASNWISVGIVRLIAGGIALLGLIVLILGLLDS